MLTLRHHAAFVIWEMQLAMVGTGIVDFDGRPRDISSRIAVVTLSA
jgi:hypothetical protein